MQHSIRVSVRSNVSDSSVCVSAAVTICAWYLQPSCLMPVVALRSTGRLDAELLQVTRRVSAVLQTLPKDITPVNLEELRRVKQVLVELESKADTLRCVLVMLCASLPGPPARHSQLSGCHLLVYSYRRT